MKRMLNKKKNAFQLVLVIISMLLMSGCEGGSDDNDGPDDPKTSTYTAYAVLTDTSGYADDHTWLYSGNTSVTVTDKSWTGTTFSYTVTVNFTYDGTSSTITLSNVQSLGPLDATAGSTYYNLTAFIDKDDSGTFNTGDDYDECTLYMNGDQTVEIASGDWSTY